MAGAPKAAAAPPRERSVFINCPFDDGYQPMLEALVFAIICCGFEPRSALETRDTSVPRMDRILDAMRASQFSVHDLSRAQGEGTSNLARFNMPFELGIAMSMKSAHDHADSKRPHDWNALVLGGADADRLISDLKGFDLPRYLSENDLLYEVVSWLLSQLDKMQLPRPKVTPLKISAKLPEVRQKLQDRRAENFGKGLLWKDIVDIGKACAKKL